MSGYLGGRSYSFRYRRLREFFLDKGLFFSSCLANWVGGVIHFVIEGPGKFFRQGATKFVKNGQSYF